LNPSATPIRVNLRFLSIESFNFLTANKREWEKFIKNIVILKSLS
jgi:hypothetical protein